MSLTRRSLANTLASALGGYLSFLGLGLPAGLVRQVADLRGRGEDGRLRRLLRLAFFLFCGIGIAGAALVALFNAGGGLAVLAIPPGAHASPRAARAPPAARPPLSSPPLSPPPP